MDNSLLNFLLFFFPFDDMVEVDLTDDLFHSVNSLVPLYLLVDLRFDKALDILVDNLG